MPHPPTAADASPPTDAAIQLAPAPPDEAPLAFHRGHAYPRAIAWFGFKSFWGHLWKLAASVIATEDIDSRDWMQPDDPDALTQRIAIELGADPSARTLTEALDRDLVIDFVADTGDDVSVSRAVAEMLFESYRAPDGTLLPRGDLLVFGGDTAYPVANELEIHNRVIVPWNRVLRDKPLDKARVLLGIPGNHDWYAGLDGFGRMFRAPLGDIGRTSVMLGKATLDPGAEKPEEIVSAAPIRHFFEWAEAFRVGRRVIKRAALPLIGYRPVQSASYWALRLAPHLDLWGPDRQLVDVDDRQRAFFGRLREDDPERGLALVMADPPWAFLEPHKAGQRILHALDLSLEGDALLALTGDIHHYCRLRFGGGMQVTAGGGGAFLHPARMSRKGLHRPEAEFPGPKATLRIALLAPWQIVRGRAGWMIHTVLLLAFLPEHLLSRWGHPTANAAFATGAVLTILLAAIGGAWKKRRGSVWAMAAIGGALLGALPWAFGQAAALAWDLGVHGLAAFVGALVLSVFSGALVVGVYFMALTILGFASDEGFGPLAHPGYKHFVRLFVKRDGSGIEGWVIGKVDPLDPDGQAVLVDRWEWKSPSKR
ncbi:MAG TPA: hypothetical protein VL400_13325 [Polyangiaceae bacterium]|nr:hypothetical protein [Polyangiaceae bacterium]